MKILKRELIVGFTLINSEREVGFVTSRGMPFEFKS